MKLYYSPGACSLAPHVVLNWIGCDYEAVRANRTDPAYLAINPAAAVPALDTGEGWTLTQAGAILHYLARRHPEAGLGGGDTLREQADMERWSSFFTGDLHPAFFPVFMPGRYTTSQDAAALDAVKAAGVLLVRKQLTLLDAHLDGRDTVVGESRSIIDAYALPMMRWATSKLPDGLAAYPNVARLLDRLHADEIVQRTLREEGAA